jgi:hypothetical protein
MTPAVSRETCLQSLRIVVCQATGDDGDGEKEPCGAVLFDGGD